MRINWYKDFPDGYQAMKGLELVAEQSKLDPIIKELVRIRASQINGCAYCLDMHTKDALGETEQRIALVAAWHEASVYSPREKAALAWCEILTLISQNKPSDDAYEELERFFDAEEIMTLTVTIVAINGWNRFIMGLKVEMRNYVSHKKPVI
jgi:AhpD family alkylhydroperoxidase